VRLQIIRPDVASGCATVSVVAPLFRKCARGFQNFSCLAIKHCYICSFFAVLAKGLFGLVLGE
jgi:hypothetical protein